MRKAILVLLLATGVCLAQTPPVKVAATLGGHGDEHWKIFEGTREALKKEFAPEGFEFVFLHTDDVYKKAEAGEIDFFISPGGKTRKLMPNGSTDLLTITTERFPNPNKSFGGLFVVRKDSPLHTIEDLQGKTAVSNRPGAFYGYQTLMSLLESQGYDHASFFETTLFPDTSNSDVIGILLKKDADVALVPSCFIEDHYPEGSPERAKLRAVAVEEKTPCLTSTPQYPNWIIAAAPKTDPEIARRLVKTLLEMETDASHSRWSITTDFSQSDRLHENLESGIFQKIKQLNFRWMFSEFKNLILLGTIGTLLVLFYALSLNWLVKKRTRALSRSLKEQIRLKNAARESERKFASLQRAGLIAQMSSMIAHELRQPLSAAQAYIHGLQRFVDLGNLSKSQTHEILGKLASQVEKAGSIVDEVRSYAKGKESHEKLPLGKLLDASVAAFKGSGRFDGELKVKKSADPICLVSTMEIELAVMNLLRNAADSLNSSRTKNPKIELELEEKNGFAIITVKDNGPKLTEEDVKRFATPLSSTKQEGLGLGLSLVKAIMANHGGTVEFYPRKSGGLAVVLKVPVIGEGEDNGQ